MIVEKKVKVDLKQVMEIVDKYGLDSYQSESLAAVYVGFLALGADIRNIFIEDTSSNNENDDYSDMLWVWSDGRVIGVPMDTGTPTDEKEETSTDKTDTNPEEQE